MEITRTKVNESEKHEIGSLAIKIGFVMAGLIGVWGLSCLLGGFVVAGGPVALVKSLFVALAI